MQGIASWERVEGGGEAESRSNRKHDHKNWQDKARQGEQKKGMPNKTTQGKKGGPKKSHFHSGPMPARWA